MMRALIRPARAAFGGLPGAFWWIWLGTLVNRMGSFVLPLLAFYLTGPLHRSAAFAGAVAALYGLGAVVSGVLGGVLADRVGRKPTLLVSLGANAASILALGYARSPLWLCLGTLTVGLASNAFRPATSAMIADLVPAEHRVRAYGLNYWAINIGFSVASLSLGLVVAFGYRALFFADAATTLGCLVVIALFVPDTTPTEQIAAAAASGEAGGIRAVLRDRVYVSFILSFLLVLLVFSQCNAAQPMAMARDGLSAAEVGYVGAINGIVIVALQLPVTRWLECFPVARVLAASSLVIGIGMAVPLFGSGIGVFAISITVWTLGEIGNTPTASAFVARIAPVHLRGRYQGVYQFAWSGAAVLAPLTGGAAFSAFGGRVVWLGCLVVSALAAAAQLRLGRSLRRLPGPGAAGERLIVGMEAADGAGPRAPVENGAEPVAV